MDTTTIILIRHAQSEKNLKDIHGGNGEALTELGLHQTELLSQKIKDMGARRDNAVITYAPNVQTYQTADIISKNLNIPIRELPSFKPLNLGVVHGLSNVEVKQNYPEVFELLTKWRNKEIEITDLNIPNMESPILFYERGREILNQIFEKKHNIFISTNSLYILLLNILLGNDCSVGGGYKHFDIQNCGISYFKKKADAQYLLIKELTNVKDVYEYQISIDRL